MKKKILLILFFVLGIAALRVSLKSAHTEEECAFCSDQILERQTFYEDSRILALYSHKPVLPGHVLIIPKRHVERFEELENEEVLQIKEAIERIHAAALELYGCDDYLLLQKNGFSAGLHIPHVHFHYYPTNEGNKVGVLSYLRLFIIPHLPPISEQAMAEAVGRFKAVLSSFVDVAYEHSLQQDADSSDHTL